MSDIKGNFCCFSWNSLFLDHFFADNYYESAKLSTKIIMIQTGTTH